MAQGVGKDIEIISVSMRYPGAENFSVTDIDVHIEAGEFFSFLENYCNRFIFLTSIYEGNYKSFCTK